MTNRPPESDRAERLVAKLRENLHRRKSQARALREGVAAEADSGLDPAPDHAGAPEPLPKPASSG